MKLLANQQQLQNIADSIISARDFCGNEREAAIDSLCEESGYLPKHNVPGFEETICAAFALANEEWENYQALAGVPAEFQDGKGGLHDQAIHNALNSND